MVAWHNSISPIATKSLKNAMGYVLFQSKHCDSFGTLHLIWYTVYQSQKRQLRYSIKLKNHLKVLVHAFIREQWWKNLFKGLKNHHLQSNVEASCGWPMTHHFLLLLGIRLFFALAYQLVYY
jgi:hypothetical protein